MTIIQQKMKIYPEKQGEKHQEVKESTEPDPEWHSYLKYLGL